MQADGNILASGEFFNIGGQSRTQIARLNPTTGLADSFNVAVSGPVPVIVYTFAVQTDGKILMGGTFNSINGQARNHIARLNSDGTLDATFNPNANFDVNSIALQPDGKILVGGAFFGANSIGGQTRNHIARLDPATGLADSFDPNANGGVTSIAVQANGKILVGGSFNGTNSIGGQTRNYIARLNPDGTADSFDPNANANIDAVAMQADGKILVGGMFGSIGGQTRQSFARLTNDVAATQNLAVTSSTITWTRSGPSPQFTRVTFESSSDNVNFSFLGNGTASGSNWTLSGLNLATQQNLYIRARGYSRGGQFDGSDSITQSVRNAFITLPPSPTQVVSRKLHGGTPFDIPLPLTGNPGVECRSGGGSNDYQLVLTFPNAVTFTNAAVTAGTGSVSGSGGNGTNSLTINLTGVSSVQVITVKLSGVSDGTATGDLDVQMGMLIGDSNGDGSVNSGDIGLTKSKSGQAIDSTNFRNDVNVDGSLNAGDVGLVKSRSGTALP